MVPIHNRGSKENQQCNEEDEPPPFLPPCARLFAPMIGLVGRTVRIDHGGGRCGLTVRFFHSGKLLRGRLSLMVVFPRLVGHAVNFFPGLI